MTTNLFTTNGTINSTAVTTLLDAINYDSYKASEVGYKAHQLTSRTYDASSTDTSATANPDNTVIFPMGYVNGDSGASLYWQATYLYNGYLTVWLVKGYTNSVWNDSVVELSYDAYANSTIQTYIDDTFSSIVTQDSPTLQSIFATPVAAGYQALESGFIMDISPSYHFNSNNDTSNENMSNIVGNNSYFWLPSHGEAKGNSTVSVSNNTTTYTGFWGLNSTDRICSITNYDGSTIVSDSYGYQGIWLRSSTISKTGTTQGVVSIEQSSSPGGVTTIFDVDSYSTYLFGVRPACHIDLNALERNASINSIMLKSNDNAFGSVSGGGNYASSYTSTTTLLATPNIGYAFQYWQDSAGNRYYNNPLTIQVTQDEVYTAYFGGSLVTITTSNSGAEIDYSYLELTSTDARYTLTFTTGNYISGITINSGVMQDITATSGTLVTDDSCILIMYGTNATGSRLYLNVIGAVSNVVINLHFVDIAQSYTPASGGVSLEGVALQVSGGSGATFEAVGEARITGYSQAENITYVHVSAVPSSGYYFVGWQTNDDTDLTDYGSSADIPYNLIEGKILTAVFAPNPSNSHTNSTTDNTGTEIG